MASFFSGFYMRSNEKYKITQKYRRFFSCVLIIMNRTHVPCMILFHWIINNRPVLASNKCGKKNTRAKNTKQRARWWLWHTPMFAVKHEIRNQWRLYLFITIIKIFFFFSRSLKLLFCWNVKKKRYSHHPNHTHHVNLFMLDFVTVWYANRNQS